MKREGQLCARGGCICVSCARVSLSSSANARWRHRGGAGCAMCMCVHVCMCAQTARVDMHMRVWALVYAFWGVCMLEDKRMHRVRVWDVHLIVNHMNTWPGDLKMKQWGHDCRRCYLQLYKQLCRQVIVPLQGVSNK